MRHEVLYPKFRKVTFFFIFFFAISTLLVSHSVRAASFNDAADGDWNLGATWGNPGNNVQGSGYPGPNDTATIDSHTVTLSADQSVSGVTISGGTLNGGSSILSVSSGGWTFSSGSFNPQTGTIKFVHTLTLTGNTIFNNLTIDTNTSSGRIITFTGYTATTTGTLTIDNSSTGGMTLTGGTIVAEGNVVWDASTVAVSTTALVVTGTSDQTVTSNNATNTSGNFLTFTINKLSGTLYLSGTIRTNQAWTYTQGTVDATTNGSSVIFFGSGGGQTITGSHTLNNVRFDSNTTSGRTFTIAAGTLLTTAGTLTLDNSAASGVMTINTGTLIVQGSIQWDQTNFAGSMSLLITGGSSQTLTISGGSLTSGEFASTTINKSGDTLTISGILRTSKNFTQTSSASTVDWTTNDSTISFFGTSNLNPGSGVYNNIYFDVTGAVTLLGNLNLQGNWTNNGSFTSGSNLVTFSGSRDSTIITGGTSITKDFQNLTVNKTGSGTVLISTNDLDIDGTLTVSAGILDINGQNISTVTTCSITGTFKLRGTETLSCSPIYNNGSTINFSGSGIATVANYGSSFKNFTSTTAGKSIIFPADTTTTITGTLTLQGVNGNNIIFKSSAAGTDGSKTGDTALLSVAAATTIDYVTIYDNDVSGVATPISTTNSTNGGNTTGWNFGTPPDITPPTISNISATINDPTSVTVTWTSDESATSSISYGLTSGYGTYTSTASFVTSHSFTITNLTPNTTYHYQVGSTDGSGNTATSSDLTFITTDTINPTITLVAPVTSTTVFGSQVLLKATSTDNVSVTGVQFKLDTNINIGSEIMSAPYILTWDTSALSGSHTVVAVARDDAGNYATSTIATINISNSGSIYLTPGSGFDGVTAQPATVGSGEASDATAIARWNVVPYQTFSDTINIGVVAFHSNYIDRVSFSVNGGEWRDVTEMTRNPETNTLEYWLTLRASDFSDGQLEVRAIAYPNQGIPRVLQGSTPGATEESLFLNANSGGTLPSTVKYVSNSGNDTTGDGTSGNPYQTISRALAVISSLQSSDVGGGVIYLQSGSYAYGSTTENTNRNSSTQWLTIQPAAGVARSSVILNSQGTGGGIRTQKVLLRNVSISGFAPNSNGPLVDYIWLDGVNAIGPGPASDVNALGSSWSGRYITNSHIADYTSAANVSILVRNVSVTHIGADAFSGTLLVVDSSVDHIEDGDLSYHPDIYQNTGTTNVILYGLIGVDTIGAQGLFSDASTAVLDEACVNCFMATSIPGHYVFQFGNTTTNLFIKDSYFEGNSAWRTGLAFVGHNIVVENTIFTDSPGEMGGITFRDGPPDIANPPISVIPSGCTISCGGNGAPAGFFGTYQPIVTPQILLFSPTNEFLQNQISTLQKRLALLLSQIQSFSNSYIFTKNLSLSMADKDVLILQKYLNLNGFPLTPTGPGSPGHETTKFGALTYKALIKFQVSKNLPATGFFGPLTRSWIQNNK